MSSPPCTNVKPPVDDFLAAVLGQSRGGSTTSPSCQTPKQKKNSAKFPIGSGSDGEVRNVGKANVQKSPKYCTTVYFYRQGNMDETETLYTWCGERPVTHDVTRKIGTFPQRSVCLSANATNGGCHSRFFSFTDQLF